MWVETRHQCGISAFVSQTSFGGEPVVASQNVGCFLRLLYVRLGCKILLSVAENKLFCFSLKPQKGSIIRLEIDFESI